MVLIYILVFLKLKNGNLINIFSDNDSEFMSPIGYGAIMGILKTTT